MQEFTHFNEEGNAVMVDVHEKEDTYRVARAEGVIRVTETVFQAIAGKTVQKGDVLSVARLAGIMGAKKNAELIPLCHNIPLTKCTVDFEMDASTLEIRAICTVSCVGKTGVEMEALTGVSVALLTIYDMCKALDRGMEISGIRLLEKQGGKSGHYLREEDAACLQ
jgi:cyclic pyranopterin phosphate synthase